MLYEHPLLLAKLKAYGLDEDSCALLRDCILNRQQSVKIVDIREIKHGVTPNSKRKNTFFSVCLRLSV